jgi:hypothetical protein
MPGIPQTLEVPPPVSVQTILYGIYQALGGSSGGGGSGISSILTPRLIWVDATNGDNATAVIGRMDKPYETLEAAYAAGVANAVDFGIVLMPNANPYTLTLVAAWNSLCASLVGYSVAGLTIEPSVRVNVVAYQAEATNANGVDGYSGAVAIEGLWLYLQASGQDVNADDGNTYTAGNGGSWSVSGAGLLTADLQGGSGNVSNGSVVNGGTGGALTLLNGVKTWGDGVSINEATGAGGGSNGNPGTLTADNCDLRVQSIIPGGDVTLGRCSYTAGAITITNNKGGNADWPA